MVRFKQVCDSGVVHGPYPVVCVAQFQTQYGWTALICAADGGQFEIVETLLKYGANKEYHTKVSQG